MYHSIKFIKVWGMLNSFIKLIETNIIQKNINACYVPNQLKLEFTKVGAST